MAENAKWYVVHTYSGYENTVAASIMKAAENRQMQDLIQEVNIPLETVVEHTDGGDKEVERKVFPGYVLVKMVLTDESWHLVRNSRGCTGFVGSDGKPVPLTEQEILDLGVERREISVGFELGDTRQGHRRPAGRLPRHGGRDRPRGEQRPPHRLHVRQGDARSIWNSTRSNR